MLFMVTKTSCVTLLEGGGVCRLHGKRPSVWCSDIYVEFPPCRGTTQHVYTYMWWPWVYVAGLCGETTTTLARCGDRKHVYRNACVTYQMHLDCETSCCEVCHHVCAVDRSVDVLATNVCSSFFSPTRTTHFRLIVYPV